MGRIKSKLALFIFTLLYLITSTVSTVFASISYQYDANGNMTSDSQYCYTYNDANQISKVKNCTTQTLIAEYIYDADGNRIIKKEYQNGTLNNTVYAPDKSYETKKIVQGGVTQNTSYYYVNDELLARKNPDGTKTFYQNDHLGSASLLTNQTGAVVEQTTYFPYGAIRSGGNQSKYLYTGKELDTETGLNYYGARYYNSHLQRFSQPDTLLPNVYDPQQLNRYSYTRNNPLKYTDPSGHCFRCILFLGGSLTLAGLEIGGGINGLVSSKNISVTGRIEGVLTGAQSAVESPVGQGALGLASLGLLLNDLNIGTKNEIVNEENYIGEINTIEKESSQLNNQQGFKTFDKLKKVLGSPGEDNQWHHNVEQNKNNIDQHGAEAIHNIKNVFSVSKKINQAINGYYSSKQSFSEPLTVREWLSPQTFEEKSSFGLDILNKFLNKK
jgi:RHS repeat-associated protein